MIRPSSDRKTLWAIGLILAAVTLSYFNSLSNGYVYDDIYIVEQNPLIRDWRNIPAILTSGYWSSTLNFAGGLYRPLTILTYLIEYQIAGLNPALGHLDNVLLHFLCCVLVYLIMRSMAGGWTGPVVAALLFAVHPVHVEAVANVVGRAELLATLFTLAGLYTFVHPPKRVPWYVISPAMLMLGLMSKETAAVLPLLILLYIALFERDGRGRSIRGSAVSLAPYALVAALFLVIRLVVLADEVYPQGAAQVLEHTRGYWRVLVMFKVFLGYIRLSFFPVELYAHYMLRPPESIMDPSVLVFLCMVLALAAMSPWLIRTRRIYFFFAAWFFIALLPVSNIIPIGILMSERSMYLPSAAVCAVGGLLASGAAGSDFPVRGRRAVAVYSLLAGLILCFGVITHERNKVWHDAASLNEELVRSYNRVISDFPESGDYHLHMARTLQMLHRDDEALASIQKAVELEPGKIAGHIELFKFLFLADDYGRALTEGRNVISMAGPDDPSLTPDVLSMLAETFFKNGMTDEARIYIDSALSADVGINHKALAEIAERLYHMGMYDESRRYILRAMELNPYMADYHLNYAKLLLAANGSDPAPALKELDIAESLDQNSTQVLFMKGLLLGRTGDYGKAVDSLEKSVSLSPDTPEFRYYLAAAYIALGRNSDADEELREALRLKPDYVEAQVLLEREPVP